MHSNSESSDESDVSGSRGEDVRDKREFIVNVEEVLEDDTVVKETGSLIASLSPVPYTPYVVARQTITNETLVEIVSASGDCDSIVFDDCQFKLKRRDLEKDVFDARNINGLHFRNFGKGVPVPLIAFPSALRDACKRLELSDCYHVEAGSGVDFPNLEEFIVRNCDGGDVLPIQTSDGKLTSIICERACLGKKMRPDPKLQCENLKLLWMVHVDHADIAHMLAQVRRSDARDSLEELLISWTLNTSACYENSLDLDVFSSLKRLTLRNWCSNAVSTRRKAALLDIFTVYVNSATPLGDLMTKYGDASSFRCVLETDPRLVESLPVAKSKFKNMEILTFMK